MPSHGFVAHVYESECPVSAITQKSFELVQIMNGLQVTHMSTGSSVSADQMPGYLLDAIRLCQWEERSAEKAEKESRG